jgi:two-component system, OmpR family, response regulator ResD
MAGERILIVDDEPTLVEVLALYLREDGYIVQTAADGMLALALIRDERPDLVVLDLMLPQVSGLEVLRQIRASAGPPVIMLTARGDETDRVVGLELGADDYVTKPFSNRELVARVKAVLRRATPTIAAPIEPNNVLLNGPLRVDLDARAVTVAEREVTLTVREYELLVFLVRHPGRVFTREQLLDQVWGYTFASDLSTVTVHIRRLREKLETDPANPVMLQTVWGVGYKLEKFKTGGG